MFRRLTIITSCQSSRGEKGEPENRRSETPSRSCRTAGGEKKAKKQIWETGEKTIQGQKPKAPMGEKKKKKKRKRWEKGKKEFKWTKRGRADQKKREAEVKNYRDEISQREGTKSLRAKRNSDWQTKRGKRAS